MATSSSGEKDGWEEELLPINKKVTSSGSTDTSIDDNSLTSTDSKKGRAPVDETHPALTECQAQRFRQAALALAWISVIVLIVLGVTSFVLSTSTESSAVFGFGFGCFLDVFTSFVVIWRFHGSVKTLYSETRERIALLFVAGFFLLSSLFILVRTTTDLAGLTHTQNELSLCILAFTSGTLCLCLAIAKMYVAKKLASKTVRSDGISSLADSVTAFSILISARVIEFNPEVWYLDSIVGFCVAAVLALYGTLLLVQVLGNGCEREGASWYCCCSHAVGSGGSCVTGEPQKEHSAK